MVFSGFWYVNGTDPLVRKDPPYRGGGIRAHGGEPPGGT